MATAFLELTGTVAGSNWIADPNVAHHLNLQDANEATYIQAGQENRIDEFIIGPLPADAHTLNSLTLRFRNRGTPGAQIGAVRAEFLIDGVVIATRSVGAMTGGVFKTLLIMEAELLDILAENWNGQVASLRIKSLDASVEGFPDPEEA